MMEKFDAIILAGGLGTRLRTSVSDLPKALAPVNGKPFLDFVLHSLDQSDCVENVVIAVGFMADKIINRYENVKNYGFNITFSVEKELMGTGGAIKKALKLTNSNDILVLNGDSYVDIDMQSFFTMHKSKNAQITIAIKEVENANRYGKVNILEDGLITSFEEKVLNQSSGYINAGVYLFKRELFDSVEENKILSLEKDLLPTMIKSNAYGFICKGKFIDIGIPETFEIASTYLKDKH